MIVDPEDGNRVPFIARWWTTTPAQRTGWLRRLSSRDDPELFLSERANVPALGKVLEAEKAGRAAPYANHAVAEVTFAVGPEGGWTDAEFLAAANAGFLEARLGDNILRTETAVVAGLAGVHLYFEN